MILENWLEWQKKTLKELDEVYEAIKTKQELFDKDGYCNALEKIQNAYLCLGCASDHILPADVQSWADLKEHPTWKILMIHKHDQPLIFDDGRDSGFPDIDGDCVGFFYREEEAVQAVLENWCDIQDMYYQAAYVIKNYPGIYQYAYSDADRRYFVWDREKQRFIETEEPERNRRIAL